MKKKLGVRERERERLSKMEERSKDVDPPSLFSLLFVSLFDFFQRLPGLFHLSFAAATTENDQERMKEANERAKEKKKKMKKKEKEDEEIRELVQR